MRGLRNLWRQFFDVRPGEYARTLFMSLYLLFVLFAYYVLKPVSRALFITRFDFDDLPYLYILIAIGGGILAYGYSRLAVRTSLRAAVGWSTAVSIACLLLMWELIAQQHPDGSPRFPWMVYVLNVWVSLFAIVLTSQGWLVASHVFDAREAKRLYGLLGMGAVAGAGFGGEFTRRTAQALGTTNLLPASAALVALAYLSFRLAAAQKGVRLANASSSGESVGSGESDADFTFAGMTRDIAGSRHLRLIMSVILITFVVDVFIEYQFQAMAGRQFKGDDLTAFFGAFYGLWLNLITFFLQLFLTAAVVRWFGVGGTLLIMPLAITFASLSTFLLPGVYTAAAMRMTEAASRYTLNRTGMELLYVPLSAGLKNRTKAFVDIFVDRFGRGVGGLLLLGLTRVIDLDVRDIALVVVGLGGAWIVLARRATAEYESTVRQRIESRRLDLEGSRVRASDRATVALLEQTALSDNPRQASYALGLLAEAPEYRIEPLLARVAESGARELRAQSYTLAAARQWPGLVARARGDAPALPAAVAYLTAAAPDGMDLAARWLEDPDPAVAAAALEALAGRTPLDAQWMERMAAASDPRRRALAARAIATSGDHPALARLLDDPDPTVASAAIAAAPATGNRVYLEALVQRLADRRLRPAAAAALAAYGPAIAGAMADCWHARATPEAIRMQIPRVLRLIPGPRSAAVLLDALDETSRAGRLPVLKALNRLRAADPNLRLDAERVDAQLAAEARGCAAYAGLAAALREAADTAPRRLLVRAIEERAAQCQERIFRLLGLLYSPEGIYAAWRSFRFGAPERRAHALEFLDSVLDRRRKLLLIPVLDQPEVAAPVSDLERALPEAAKDDPWLSACIEAAEVAVVQ